MKKLILYGVSQVKLRRDIEYFLDDDWEIIGYSDTYYTSDVLDGKRFIPPNQLSHTEFDYIMPLSFRENILADMRSGIIDQGVPPEKIIRPVIFLGQGIEAKQPDLIGDIGERYQGEEGLIFGASSGYMDIIEKKLRPAFYNCSWLGMDLYYYYRIFQYMRRRGLLSRVKTALVAFHYHWFNHDMSRSAYQYRSGQIFALRGLDDWHNYRQAPEGPDYVANYRMFGRKLSEFYHFHKHEYQNRAVYQGKDGEYELSGPWVRDYPETVAENTALLADFFHELAEAGITPVIMTAPKYVKGLSRAALEHVKKRKQEFYQVMDMVGSGIKVFDFFDVYADRREFFQDFEHLNADGAEVFTERINQTILREMKEKNV